MSTSSYQHFRAVPFTLMAPDPEPPTHPDLIVTPPISAPTIDPDTLIPMREAAERLSTTKAALVKRAGHRGITLTHDRNGTRCVAERDIPALAVCQSQISRADRLAAIRARYAAQATEKLAETHDEHERTWLERLPLIGAAVEEVTGISMAEIIAPNRTTNCALARKVLVLVLRRHDLTVMHIARLVHRDHATVLHSLATCGERTTYTVPPRRHGAAALVAEVTAGSEEVLTLLAVRGLHVPARVDDGPMPVVLDATLATLDSQYRRAVTTFVRGPLLGQLTRYEGATAAWGLLLLASNVALRTRVVGALCRANLAPMAARIEGMAARCGYAWVVA